MRTRVLLVGLLAGLCAAGAVLATSPAASATVPPTDPPVAPVDPNAPASTVVLDPENGLPAAQGPLVVLPAGCVSPAAPMAVFEGTITDAVSTTARFRVERMLSGSLQGYLIGDLVDVRYGDETRFLDVGGTYVVGVARSAEDGLLVSTVREAAPLFGGDAVVGVNDSDVECITLDDPVRTLMPDGTAVDTGVLAPLRGNSKSLVGAIARPLAIALGVLLALVVVKHLLFGIGRALRDMGDAPPVERARRHELP
ncbi:MAG: hypothetical protein RL238_202 [Actinomycetota bacterium]|jgi:hypothetical protein